MITRAPRPTSNFYLLDKSISQDKRLSWAARGLLIYLLGKPDNWHVSVQALANETKNSGKHSSRDAVRGLLNELIKAGYCTRQQLRKADGTLCDMQYFICEDPGQKPCPDKPCPDKPCPDKPCPDKPCPANPTLVSIEEETSTEKEVRIEEEKKGFSAKAPPDGVSHPLWADFKKLRAAKKAAITETAMRGIARESEKAGISLAEALTTCCERGWTGFRADWYQSAEKRSEGLCGGETAYQRSIRERVAEIAPEIARKAPGQARSQTAVEFFEVEARRVAK